MDLKIKEALASKKVKAAIIGGASQVLVFFIPSITIEIATLMAKGIFFITMLYLASQGLSDAGKEKAKIEAEVKIVMGK